MGRRIELARMNRSKTVGRPGLTRAHLLAAIGFFLALLATVGHQAPAFAAQDAPLDCTSFASYEEANDYYAANPDALAAIDDDGDGQACEVYFGLESRDPETDTGDPAAAPQDDAAREDDDIDCEDFTTQEEAQAVLDSDPTDPNNLDPNRDGIACALLPSATDGSAEQTEVTAEQDSAAPNETREERRARRNRDAEETPVQISCADFATAADAQAAFDADPAGMAALDEDGNGVACEELIEVTPPDDTADREARRAARQARDEDAGVLPTPVAIEDIDCIDFDFQEEAQAVYDQNPSDPFNLDPNGDGFACSSLPFATETIVQVPRTGVGASRNGALPLGLTMAGIVAGIALLQRRVRLNMSRR